jgi:hypothetical protein
VNGFCLGVTDGRKRKSDETRKDTRTVKSGFAFVLHRIGLGTEVFERPIMRRV